MNTIPEHHYPNEPKGLKSWLLTLDHKRIGLMYFFAIMSFELLGNIKYPQFYFCCQHASQNITCKEICIPGKKEDG